MSFDGIAFLADVVQKRSPFTFVIYFSALLLCALAAFLAVWVLANRKSTPNAPEHGGSPAGEPGKTKDKTDRLAVSRHLSWVLVLVTMLATAYFSIQIYISYQLKTLSAETERQYSTMDPNQADYLKKVEEAIAVRIENRRKSVFWATFIANISATLGIVAGIGTVWIGIWKYSRAHERQLEDRAREHKDRIAGELSNLWQYAVSGDSMKRAGSAAGLQEFLDTGKEEFRPRAVAALALIGRMQSVDEDVQKELSVIVMETYRRLLAQNQENTTEKVKEIIQNMESTIRQTAGTNEILKNTLTPVIEYAMRHVDNETLVSVSWKGLKLHKPDFHGADLVGIDFRDAILEEANFQGAKLRKARFDAASLKGALFDGASMPEVSLEYADIAGASLKKANLDGAILNNVRLLDADLTGCSLRRVVVNWDELDIGLTKNWRKAEFYQNDDPPADKERGTKLQKALLQKYGKRRDDKKRVLMLMWEMEPIVSGGGWTAAYHLVKNVCRKGVSLTIMVPWIEKSISKEAFGNEVELIPLGVETETAAPAQYEDGTADAQGLLPGAPKTYSETSTPEQLLTYAYTYSRSHADIVNQFASKAVKYVKSRGYGDIGVIHAHDWLTFTAAMCISKETKIPWIAHFHSLEADRRKKAARWIAMVERRACEEARVLIVPSKLTKMRLVEKYNARKEKITVVPNCLSENDYAEGHLVDIDRAKVIFAGRGTWQKGPDHFIYIARMIERLRPRTKFTAFGMDGRERPSYLYAYNISYGTIADLIRTTKDESAVKYLEPMSEAESRRFAEHITSPAAARIEAGGDAVLDKEKEEAAAPDIAGLLKCGCTLRRPKGLNGYDYIAIPDDDYERDGIDGYCLKLTDLDVGSVPPEEAIETRRFVPWSRRSEIFRDASAVVVPSRHEPFGMIVLEAMQAGVPVFVSSHAGVNEVVKSVTQIDESNHFETARKIVGLLRDCPAWQAKVDAQFAEIRGYMDRQFENTLMECWKKYL